MAASPGTVEPVQALSHRWDSRAPLEDSGDENPHSLTPEERQRWEAGEGGMGE